MSNLRLDRWLDYLTGETLVWTVLWLGLAGITITLLVTMATRWGQSKPLGKCVVLSLLTHAMFATYATTVEIVAAAPRELLAPVHIFDEPSGPIEQPGADEGGAKRAGPARPWDPFATSSAPPLDTADLDTAPPDAAELDPANTAESFADRAMPSEEQLPGGEPSLAGLPDDEARQPDVMPLAPAGPLAAPSAAAEADEMEAIAGGWRDANESDVVGDSGPARFSPAESTSDIAPSTAGKSPSPDYLETLNTNALRSSKMSDSPATPIVGAPSAERPKGPKRTASSVAPETAGPETGVAGRGTRAREADLGALVGGKSPGPSGIGGAGAGAAGLTAPRLGARRSSSGDANVPQMFQLRKSRNKAGIVAGQGGSADTEKAVKAALQWLATHQDADGRWDASQFEAGKERKVLGQDRAGAGAEADTGVSGLALLAFLGAGHTHLEGEYAQVVENGLSFLLASQHPDDGHIGGAAEHFAFMYCHGMATLALGEAYAMTHDERLLEPLRHAVNYTVRSQVAKSGSWRYLPGDAYGDTSQLGWQLMALKSAEQAGMEIPRRTQEGMVKFLKAVSTGTNGGLAKYRADRGERPTRTMTAEALVCRQFLGMARGNPASNEAGDFILGELPGSGQPNYYYWYYATIGMFQLQGVYRDRWNSALTSTLLSSQRASGDEAGSWDPNDVWGGHGGRVYSTALGALCLEVYYRYLPLYGNTPLPEGGP